MHVVHVGKYYPPYRGGIETVVEQLSRGMVRHGLKITVVVSNDGTEKRDEWLDGVRVIRLPRQAVVNSQPLNWSLLATLRALEFDLLHFHTPNPIGALSVLAARRREPIVVTHHSDIIRQRVLGGVATAAHALLYRSSRAVLAATPRHIEYSTILRQFEARCRVIHFPIDPRPYAAAEPLAAASLPSGWEGNKVALFVGRLVYYKGVDVLLDALARTPGVCLGIVGVGPLRDSLVARANALNIADRVTFFGAVEENRLLRLFKTADIFVLPSVAASEAFGMVQLEAMAAERPVISTNLRSGVPYVNQHGKTGLIVPPNDAPSLAGAIRRLASDPEYAKTLGQNGRRRVIEDFDVDVVVRQHISLYQELCS